VCVRVRLLKKLALFLDGIDLTSRKVGEIFDCSDEGARLLVLEGWAEFVDPLPEPLGTVIPEVFVFEPPNLPFWYVIEFHRNGKKDKLGSSGADVRTAREA
jgi:hypothetical protein